MVRKMLKKIRKNIRVIHIWRLVRMCVCFPAHIAFHIFRIIGMGLGPIASLFWFGYLGYLVYLNICGEAWCGIAEQIGIMLGLGFCVGIIAGTGSLLSGIVCKMTYRASEMYAYDDAMFAREKRYLRLQKKQSFSKKQKEKQKILTEDQIVHRAQE